MSQFAPGDVVQVRKYDYMPSFWDSTGHMMKLMGTIQVVATANSSRIALEGHRWGWRQSDLILINTLDGRKVDPNTAFIMHKSRGQYTAGR